MREEDTVCVGSDGLQYCKPSLPTHTVSSSLITNSLLPHSNNLLHDIYFFYISQLLY